MKVVLNEKLITDLLNNKHKGRLEITSIRLNNMNFLDALDDEDCEDYLMTSFKMALNLYTQPLIITLPEALKPMVSDVRNKNITIHFKRPSDRFTPSRRRISLYCDEVLVEPSTTNHITGSKRLRDETADDEANDSHRKTPS